MLLKVRDRLLLGKILPIESDFQTLKILRDLKSNLSFDEKEFEELQFKKEGEVYNDNGIDYVVPIGSIYWNNQFDVLKEIEIGKVAFDIIVSRLKELNSAKKLNDELFDLYLTFIPEE
jgi:hypothetical protein